MTMNKTSVAGSLPQKIIACVLVLICVAIGAVGLVLPIIPGLLFLAIAVLIGASYFPWMDARLRGHRTIAKHMNDVDRFRDLRFRDKVQIAGWLSARMLLESLALIGSFVAKLGAALRSR